MRRTLEEEQRARKELEKIVRRVLKDMNDPTWDETNLWDHARPTSNSITTKWAAIPPAWTEAANYLFNTSLPFPLTLTFAVTFCIKLREKNACQTTAKPSNRPKSCEAKLAGIYGYWLLSPFFPSSTQYYDGQKVWLFNESTKPAESLICIESVLHSF